MTTSGNNPNTSGAGYAGQLGLYGKNSDFNSTSFLVEQMLGLVRTATLVKIVSCTRNNADAPIGFVDVTPIINQMDGLGNASPHGTIYSCCYTRVQGGTNAIICDPQPGDIGVAVISDRDISSAKNSQTGPVNPGSFRRFDLADGIYLFPVFSQAPQQYVTFTNNGITLYDKNGNYIITNSSGISINGVMFDRSQNITQVTEVTATGGHTLTQHEHPGVQTGSSNTNKPIG